MIKKANLINSTFVVALIITTSCNTKVSNEALEINDSLPANEASISTEGTRLNEVNIGNQVWMTENLNVDKFRNGDPIPEAKTEKEWLEAGINHQPAWCYYDNSLSNGEKYGKLYNWYAVNDPRGLAPEGWKIPSDEEWTELTIHLDGKVVAGTKLKSKSGWNENGHGNNSSGFSGLPGGYRHIYGYNYEIGDAGYWWSSTQTKDEDLFYGAWARNLEIKNGDLNRLMQTPDFGLSVRCIKI
jgi:uncharacterized protein (TIGR02145 family)